jgi:PAS domain S-box-containing protein
MKAVIPLYEEIDSISLDRLYKIIAEFSVDWIYWINPDSSIGFVSPSCKYITGYRSEEFINNPDLVRNIIEAEDCARYDARLENVEKGNVFYDEEFKIITKNGERKWIYQTSQAVYDNDNVYLGRYVNNKDISNYKDRWCNNCLKEDIYDSVSIGNYHVYPDGKIKYANDIVVKMLGYKNINELLPVNFESLIILNLAKRKKIKNILSAIGSLKNIETEWIKKDGSILYLKENIEAIKDNNDNVLYYDCVVHNITAMKQAERSLKETENKKNELEKLKTEFLATISHEIGTPLNVILNLTKMLKTDLQKENKHELAENANIIEVESQRIQRTINLILEMSQLVTKTYDYKPEAFDLYEDIVRPIYYKNKPDIENKNLKFVISKKVTNTMIIADKHSVYQIFIQLIDNAIKYTKKGKIEIAFYLNKTDQIDAYVIDNGMGIDEKFLPYIFSIFSQEDNSYSRMFEGTGLGLALVKKYCELNNFEIIVRSKKGEGTAFRITFPHNFQIVD